MNQPEDKLPGTAKYYERHIYPRLSETIPIGSHDDPSNAVQWILDLDIVKPDQDMLVLEIGCGAGRNLVEARRLLPAAKLYGFDGSPYALLMAREAIPEAMLAFGDFHTIYPFKETFDLIFDIKSGIPESSIGEALEAYVQNLYQALQPGGFAVIEAISLNDPSSQRFGRGNLVTWEHNGETKIERLITLDEAVTLYQQQGFQVITHRIEAFEAFSFNARVQRELIQILLQRPNLTNVTLTNA